MRQPAKRIYTPEEYLAREEAAEYKSEYDNGEIIALAAGSRDHSLIEGNIHTTLNLALRSKPCEVHGSDLRLYIERSQLYTYPDVMVICGPPQFFEERNDTVINPIVIVEVLSPSTREYDRVKKFARYKQLDSLRE